jgi:hypothetical protein
MRLREWPAMASSAGRTRVRADRSGQSTSAMRSAAKKGIRFEDYDED